MLKLFDDERGWRGREHKVRGVHRSADATRRESRVQRASAAGGVFPAGERSEHASLEFVGKLTKPKHSGEVNYTLISRNRKYTAAAPQQSVVPRARTYNVIRRNEMRSSNAKRDPDTELNYLSSRLNSTMNPIT